MITRPIDSRVQSVIVPVASCIVRNDVIEVLRRFGIETGMLQSLPLEVDASRLRACLESIPQCRVCDWHDVDDLPPHAIGVVEHVEHVGALDLISRSDAMHGDGVSLLQAASTADTSAARPFRHYQPGHLHYFVAISLHAPDAAEAPNLLGDRVLRETLRGRLLELLLFALVTNLLATSIPVLVSVIIDKVIVHSDIETLCVLTVVLAFVVVSEVVLTFLKNQLFNVFSTQITASWAGRLFQRLSTLPLLETRQEATGRLVNRMQAINTVNSLITDTAVIAVVDVIFLVLFICCMVWLSPALTLGSLLFLILFGLISLWLAGLLGRRGQQVFEASAAYQSRLVEVIRGFESIKSLALSSSMRDGLETCIARVLDFDVARRAVVNLQDSVALLVTRLNGLFVIAWGAVLVIRGDLGLGQLIAFYIFLGMLQAPVQRLAHLAGRMTELGVALSRVRELFALPSERQRGVCVLDDWRGDLELRDLCYAYPGAPGPCLRDVNVRIQRGQVIAVIGASGSGKSTLAKLIGGLLMPDTGQILYGATSSSMLAPEVVRQRVAHASQDSILFAASVLDNIRIAQPHCDIGQVIGMARLTQAHAFIDALPRGYEETLREAGANLSGGQRQRLILARELLRDAPLLILDEATNAIDETTEKVIFRELLALRKNMTTLFITHKAALAQLADVVLEVRDGRLVPVAEVATERACGMN